MSETPALGDDRVKELESKIEKQQEMIHRLTKKRLLDETLSYDLPEMGQRLPEPFREASEYFTGKNRDKFVPKWLADDIMKFYRLITLSDTKEIYVYDKDAGIYRPNGNGLIRSVVAINLRDKHKKHYGDEVVYQIQVSTFRDRENLKVPDGLLVVRNGLYDVENDKLNSFTPDIFALNTLPVAYDPDANCSLIKKFVSEIVKEEDGRVLQEGVGYCLRQGYPYHKAFMLIGDGGNGKTTFFKLLIAFLGRENVSNVSLQDIIYNRFAAAELFGKLGNIYDDLSDKALRHTGKFKMATGGGVLKGEKKFKNPFFFSNEAKMWFSTNQIPEANDTTIAFFRRWILINFPNTFLPDNPKTDPDLIDKLTTDSELSGLLNWSLEGLRRLDRQRGFSYTRAVDEVQRQYERMSNPIKAFRQDHLLVDSTSVIPKNELYGYYVNYCIDNGLPAKAKNMFSMLLYRELPSIEETRIREGKNRVQCWKGVRYSETKIEKSPDHPDRVDQGKKQTKIIDATGKHTLQMNTFYSKLDELEGESGEAVKDESLFKVLEGEKWTKPFFEKIRDTLLRDGHIFRPPFRQGCLRVIKK